MAVLTPETFDFVLTNELKRALRSQNFVTLVLIEPRGASGEPMRHSHSKCPSEPG